MRIAPVTTAMRICTFLIAFSILILTQACGPQPAKRATRGGVQADNKGYQVPQAPAIPVVTATEPESSLPTNVAVMTEAQAQQQADLLAQRTQQQVQGNEPQEGPVSVDAQQGWPILQNQPKSFGLSAADMPTTTQQVRIENKPAPETKAETKPEEAPTKRKSITNDDLKKPSEFRLGQKNSDSSVPNTTPTPQETSQNRATIPAQQTEPAKPPTVLGNLQLPEDFQFRSAPKDLLPEPWKSALNLESIREKLFQQINADRVANGLRPVSYDPIAQRAGEVQAAIQVTKPFSSIGHYSPNGDLPYMRYSLVGGNDLVAENASNSRMPLDYVATDLTAVPSMCQPGSNDPLWVPIVDPIHPNNKTFKLRTGNVRPENLQKIIEDRVSFLHCWMVNEPPEHDGHKRNILDPDHTAVGLGIDVGLSDDGKILVIGFYQEFVTKELQILSPLPILIGTDAKNVTFKAKPLPGFKYSAAQLRFETRQQRTDGELASINSYGYPDYIAATFLTVLKNGWHYSPETLSRITNPKIAVTVDEDGTFTIPMTFDNGPGVYTLMVAVAPDSQSTSAIRNPIFVTSRSVYVVDPNN